MTTQDEFHGQPGPRPVPPTTDHSLLTTVWHRLRAVAAAKAAYTGLTAGHPPPTDAEIADMLWWSARMPGRTPAARLRLPASRPVAAGIETTETDDGLWAEATNAAEIVRIIQSAYLGSMEHRSAGWRRPEADGGRPPIDEVRIPLPAADGEDPLSAGASVEIRTVPCLDGTLSSSPRHVLVLALGWAGGGAIERIEYGRDARLRASRSLDKKSQQSRKAKKDPAGDTPESAAEDRLHRAAQWAAALYRAAPAIETGPGVTNSPPFL